MYFICLKGSDRVQNALVFIETDTVDNSKMNPIEPCTDTFNSEWLAYEQA